MAMQLGEATMSPGMISGDVKTMQLILAGQGYKVGPIDGIFGPQTLEAVAAFQSSKGLVPDGIVGPLTWDALHGKVSVSSAGPVVAAAPLASTGESVMDLFKRYWWVPVGLTVGAMLMKGKR